MCTKIRCHKLILASWFETSGRYGQDAKISKGGGGEYRNDKWRVRSLPDSGERHPVWVGKSW
jgi:hypothetical protein